MNIESVFKDKVSIYGDKESRYSGSIDSEVKGEDVKLIPCRMCGGNHQRIVNTHTPSYWIECACGVELHSSYIAEDGNAYSDIDFEECRFDNRDSCYTNHLRAFTHIVDKWNNLGTVSDNSNQDMTQLAAFNNKEVAIQSLGAALENAFYQVTKVPTYVQILSHSPGDYSDDILINVQSA